MSHEIPIANGVGWNKLSFKWVRTSKNQLVCVCVQQRHILEDKYSMKIKTFF